MGVCVQLRLSFRLHAAHEVDQLAAPSTFAF